MIIFCNSGKCIHVFFSCLLSQCLIIFHNEPQDNSVSFHQIPYTIKGTKQILKLNKFLKQNVINAKS